MMSMRARSSRKRFKDKIVLIGATAFGVGTPFVTPVSENMQPVTVLANVVASILNQDFFVVPDWAYNCERLIYLAIALFLILVLPRLSASLAAIISAPVAGVTDIRKSGIIN